MKAIILAAGYATRLYPLTLNTPKPLLVVGSQTMLDRIMTDIDEVDYIDTVYVVTNHKFHTHFEAWAKQCGSMYSKKIVVLDDMTDSDENKLGAIGDIRLVIDTYKLDDDLLVVCGDNLFEYRLTDMATYFKRTGCDCICVKKLPYTDDLKRLAIVSLDENKTVVEMQEKPEKPKTSLAAYGTYIYRKDTLPLFAVYQAEGNVMDAPGHFPSWLYKRKPVKAFIFTEEIYDIGTHEALKEVREKYK